MVMNNNDLRITLNDERWQTVLPDYETVSNQVWTTSLAYVKEHEDIDFLQSNKPIAVNLALSNDSEIQKLNAEFRHLDKPTNVLSFANIDDEDFDNQVAYDDVIELGDIMIALETMEREAEDQKISFADHYSHLLAHGILHLLGFDHQQDDEAEYMEGFEINILQQLNVANPYKEQ